MGGQIEYFGLWLSADYGTGHSRARPKCTTYNSPRLSKDEEFKVQLLEVWGVGDPVLPDQDEVCICVWCVCVCECVSQCILSCLF